MLNKLKTNYKLYLCILGIIILMFLPYFLFNDGIMISPGDPFELNYKLWLGGWTQIHNGDLGQFNWSLGLGANTFSYVFYFLTNPLFWISLLLPRDFIPNIFLLNLIVQLWLGFVMSHLWLSKLTDNKLGRIVGAFSFSLGAYGIFFIQSEQFLKALFFYALILYCVENYLQEDKRLGLCLAIGILGITQYFLLYQFIPFLLLYTLFRFIIIHQKELKISLVIAEGLKFLAYLFLGIGISAVVLLPCGYLVLSMPRFSGLEISIFDHLNLKQIYELFTGIFTPVGSKLDANAFIASYNHDFIGWSGGTILYSLIITPLLLIGLVKLQDKFKRNLYIAFLAVLIIFAFFDIFSYLFQATIDTRWYYMFFLLFAMINAEVITDIQNKENNKWLIWSAIAIAITIIACLGISAYKQLNDFNSLYKLGLCELVVIIIMFSYVFLLLKKKSLKVMVIMLAFEVIFSGYYYYLNNENVAAEVFSDQLITTNISEILKDDDSFYRVMYDKKNITNNNGDLFTITSSNEPMANGYNGFAFYESIYNTNQELFLNRFKSTWNMPQMIGRTKIYNLLSAKYWYTFAHEGPVPVGYDLIYKDDDLEIYENENYIELGFAYEKTINIDAVLNLSYLEQDRIMQEYLITDTSDNYTYELNDDLELLAILPDEKFRVFTFEEPISNVVLYFETFGIPNVKITTYYQDQVIDQYDIWQFNYIDIPIHETIDKVVIEGEDIYGNGTDIYLYKEDIDGDYSAYLNNFNERFSNVNFETDRINADISINKDDTYVFTSIPYDKGWSVYVDGQKIEYEKVQLGFIGFTLNSGDHHVEFKYDAPLFKEGIIISIGCIILLCCLKLKEKRKNV